MTFLSGFLLNYIPFNYTLYSLRYTILNYILLVIIVITIIYHCSDAIKTACEIMYSKKIIQWVHNIN